MQKMGLVVKQVIRIQSNEIFENTLTHITRLIVDGLLLDSFCGCLRSQSWADVIERKCEYADLHFSTTAVH